MKLVSKRTDAAQRASATAFSICRSPVAWLRAIMQVSQAAATQPALGHDHAPEETLPSEKALAEGVDVITIPDHSLETL